jgi:hypothetical protein
MKAIVAGNVAELGSLIGGSVIRTGCNATALPLEIPRRPRTVMARPGIVDAASASVPEPFQGLHRSVRDCTTKISREPVQTPTTATQACFRNLVVHARSFRAGAGTA